MRIYPRGERGILWVDLSIDGQRIKRSTGTTERNKAQEFAAALETDLWRSKRLGEAPRVTWDHAVLSWLAEFGHRKSIEDIKYRLTWLSARLAGKALVDITNDRIRKLAAERKAEPISDAKPTTSNATVNRHLAELSKILHYAHRRGWLPAMPPIAKMHEPAKRVTWLTVEQAQTLLDELPDHLRAMAAFSLATGLRETNVRLLCWQQVDLPRRVAWVYADQTKAGKDLNVPLNLQAVQVLQEQQGKHSRWVFPVPRWETKEHPDDKPVQTADAPTGKISNHAWRKACTRAGVPWLRFHDLRHTWASWHVQAGTPLPVLQELGGWASLTMVQRYGHLGQTHVNAWADNCSKEAYMPTPRKPEGTPHGNQVHGFAQRGKKTPTYLTWESMIRRCHNPNQETYKNYGAKGIVVCQRWRESFEAFLADVGEKPDGFSIDRIDSTGDYEPGNVQWANTFAQARNRSTNHRVTFDGRTQTITEWAEELGLRPKTLQARIVEYGWSVRRALTEPLGGTTAVQPHCGATNENGPEGPLSQEKPLGWLMGLEPTTTGITKRSQRGQVLKINSLRAPKKRKTG